MRSTRPAMHFSAAEYGGMANWQFWTIIVLLGLSVFALFVIGEQLKAIHKLLDQINRGVWHLVDPALEDD